MSQPPDLLDTEMSASEGPRHGFQGNRGVRAEQRQAPLGLTIAISREAGARGGSIGRRVARKLGWQVFDQELMEYMAQDAVARQGLEETLSPACLAWIESRQSELQRRWQLDDFQSLARVILTVAAQGDVILIGRGAGYILPRRTTLHVRIMAPLADRVAYMAQWSRLNTSEAGERVRASDERRADFITRQFGRAPADVHQYDMVLNSSYLGEETCADLIAQASQARWAAVLEGDELPSGNGDPESSH